MHVAITGASSGIGEALVREYVRHGARVTMVARRADQMAAIAREVGGTTLVLAADLSDVEHACDWLAPAQATHGPIDILINNAGVQIIQSAANTDPLALRNMLNVDLITPLVLTRAILPDMLARKSGTIVDVASMASLAPTPGMWGYNAAKGGLGAASESLRGELRKTGVHVLTVYPGPVDTPMARAGYHAYQKGPAVTLLPEGTTDVLARLIRVGVERKKARIIYPRSYTISRHFPAFTRWFLDRFTPSTVK